MSEEPLGLTIFVQDQADQEELDRLTRQLCDEINELDVEDVHLAEGPELPVGAKGDPITIGSIVVALASAGVFTGLIELIKSWALRREGRTITIKAKVGDREVELAYSPAETSPEEMTQFLDAIMGTLQKRTRSRRKSSSR